MSQDYLNDAYLTLRCSLLQYVAENSPWTPYTDEESAQKLQKIVARQNEQIQRLADVIVARQGFLPRGSYPADFTDMQYLSLAYLLKKLIPDQQHVLATLEANRDNISNDPGASDLVSQMAVGVAENLQGLKALAEPASHEETAAAE